jgi:hypothetical protein
VGGGGGNTATMKSEEEGIEGKQKVLDKVK